MWKKISIVVLVLAVLMAVSGVVAYSYYRVWLPLRPAIGPIPITSELKPTPGSRNLTSLPLVLPKGFQIETFAEGLGPARFMTFDKNGILLVTVTRDDKVIALPDANQDGKADTVLTLKDDLNLPHGIEFYKGELYIAENDKIRKYQYISNGPSDVRLGQATTVVPDLPEDGVHFTRTLTFGTDGKMYVSVGSSANVDIEDDKRRAAILRYNPDGTGFEIFATGLRNSVGLAWNPVTRELWATENGRDLLGDDIPPDEVNIIRKGGDYGWPFAYGNKVTDPAFDDSEHASKTIPAYIELQAHSAPLGLAFFTSDAFGKDYKDDLFIAFHGSWNRSVPTGYKVVRVHLTGKNKDQVASVEDFVTGFLVADGAIGRPAGIVVGKDGALYFSDDKDGRIYRVTKIPITK